MLKKFIIISAILLVSLAGIVGTVKLNSNPKEETKNEELITDSKEDTKTSIEDVIDVNDEKDITTKADAQIESTPKKEEEKQEIKTTTQNNNYNHTNKTSNNTNNAKATSPAPKEEHKVQEPVKNSGPWEAWGMSETEYYNAPYPKGARVDYDVNKYGSESACMNACTAKGDQIYGYIYSCDRITSASGKFLGVMLDLEEVN